MFPPRAQTWRHDLTFIIITEIKVSLHNKINSFLYSQRLRFIKSSFLKVSFVVETLKVFVLKRKLEMHFQVELVTITYLVSLDFNWVGMNIEQ